MNINTIPKKENGAHLCELCGEYDLWQIKIWGPDMSFPTNDWWCDTCEKAYEQVDNELFLKT